MIDPLAEEAPVLADVWLADGTIIAVEPSAPEREHPPGRVRIVEGDGRFLVPGFVDTHAHVALGPVELDTTGDTPALALRPDTEVPRRSLLTLLAHGVTTVRDPGGPTEALVELRRELEVGTIASPRLRVAGAVIDRLRFPGLTPCLRLSRRLEPGVPARPPSGAPIPDP